MQKLLVFVFALSLAVSFSAQTDTTEVPVKKPDTRQAPIKEFMDERSGNAKLRWTRDVMWFNLDKPLDFHNEMHSYLRLINLVDPANPVCVENARKVEEMFGKSIPVQAIHVLFVPEGQAADTAYARAMIMRHELHLPVAVFTSEDPREVFEIGQMPYMALTFSGGRIFKKYNGPAESKELSPDIDGILARAVIPAKVMGRLQPTNLVMNQVPRKLIAAPTHVVYASGQSRLYVSDHQRNRILLVDLDGQINERIGENGGGFRDGVINNAQFNGPSGLAYDSQTGMLYVADTHNHAIRQVNTRNRQVTTILGTGTAASLIPKEVYGTTAPIHSPTDITLRGGKLYIAMTGFNQVWEMDLITQAARPLAGSGDLQTVNNTDALEAGFEGPASLAFDAEGQMLILDKITGNVRSLNLETGVGTVFYNDSSEVKLISPASIANVDGQILITDPLAHKVYSLSEGELSIWVGKDEHGYKNGKKGTLGWPSGMAMAAGELIITDEYYGILRTASPKKPRLGTFSITGFDGLLGFEQGITSDTQHHYPETRISDGLNTLNFKVDVGDDYVVLSHGRNEIAIADGKSTTRKMRDDGWFGGEAVFEVDNVPGNYYLQFEVYCTYSPIDNPNIIYYKSMAVLLPFHEETIDKSTHSFVIPLNPNIDHTLLP